MMAKSSGFILPSNENKSKIKKGKRLVGRLGASIESGSY
jgi:hypothetical protein